MSFDRLIKKIAEMQNPVCVGLDPNLDLIPSYIKQKAVENSGENLTAASEAIFEFNKGLIDELCDIVPAIKPQCAYYETYGWEGIRALYKTIGYAKDKGMFVITDGKRNDIGSTMEAYAAAHLGNVTIGGNTIEPFGGDALTVNGYLGSDGITPLLKICEENDKGIFVLAKTSNKSSGELQDKFIDGLAVYEIMGRMCEAWGENQIGQYGYSAVGAVVGATYPSQLSELRKKLPRTLFLVPGYGAQGAGANDVAPAFDKNGLGAIINSSRAIMYAYKKEGCDEKLYAKAARTEALKMRDEIMAVIKTIIIF